MSPKVLPFKFFQFSKRMDVQELPKAPLLQFLALCDLPETEKIEKNSEFFFNLLLIRVLCSSDYSSDKTIVVTFFRNQRSDRFYKLRPLTATLVTSTAT